jgi:hypothetical protein
MWHIQETGGVHARYFGQTWGYKDNLEEPRSMWEDHMKMDEKELG